MFWYNSGLIYFNKIFDLFFFQVDIVFFGIEYFPAKSFSKLLYLDLEALFIWISMIYQTGSAAMFIFFKT